ncbi:UDP-N-acetylglucosamine diphosphorylase/glucosamine-1-phosphate N-acetyltransferase [Sedimentisphaera cyanobacteriorum]|uniref:UDP-N-acetylglucosamine diphosphorylase/glucosamine-1-phosphate N-acetyltransferase n=1 Tax=Sedimentisphaera cyanobacteriorum TaxID=1940790 RepID=A0A1Q2HMR2_9BACT|nr:sugar phosphate nucleotidyltransferase [Sedimentisphaera cyanobacteriorum]AQQ08650.1 UDP-N-acetylglucosamine diphosphorylase/glucosamine-1-phosphate N-acetyltransferase [Sedimentisphaera cyanobacteriorum]
MKPSLVVMAAGMGSRYGGLKQLDSVGPSGESIIEYSLFDAIRVGFGKVVFVVREEFKQIFHDKIGSVAQDLAEVDYACQELDAMLYGREIPEGRTKPWGTGHAVLTTKDLIETPFAVINADDFYGKQAFEVMAEFLSHPRGHGEYAMSGFSLKNTLSEYGSVSRGLCSTDGKHFLKKVEEYKEIFWNNGEVCSRLDSGEQIKLNPETMTSMNFWGFQQDIYEHLEQQFHQFIDEHGSELKSEFFIPNVVDRLINENKACVNVLPTSGTWFGVTYKEDKQFVQENIAKLTEKGIYPENLWEKK